jgi:hypothetical protein
MSTPILLHRLPQNFASLRRSRLGLPTFAFDSFDLLATIALRASEVERR